MMNGQMLQQLLADHIIEMQSARQRLACNLSPLKVDGLKPETSSNQSGRSIACGVFSLRTLIQKIMQALVERHAWGELIQIISKASLVILLASQILVLHN
jgi:hypothetical protein